MRIKPVTVTVIIFMIFALVFGGVGYGLLGYSIALNGKTEDIRAMITEIHRRDSDSHDVYVTYEYDGQVYENIRINEYSSTMREGKWIDLKIDPSDPTNVSSTKVMLIIGGIFAAIGTAMLFGAVIMLVKSVKKATLGKRLKEQGYYIEADFDRVDFGNVRINNRPTFILRCIYRDPYDGKCYAFRSELLRDDPTAFIEGDKIKVYVDENNYMNNYIDVDELMKNYIQC